MLSASILASLAQANKESPTKTSEGKYKKPAVRADGAIIQNFLVYMERIGLHFEPGVTLAVGSAAVDQLSCSDL